MVEADAHTASLGILLRIGKLLIYDKLNILVEFDGEFVFGGKEATFFGLRTLKRLGPIPPGPTVAVLFVQKVVQRAVKSKLVEQFSFALAERLKCLKPLRAGLGVATECSVQEFQELSLE